MTANFKTPMLVSDSLRQFARGQECQMRSEWCNGDRETVVLCHSRRRAGTGMAQKPHDFWAYHGCSSCHAAEHMIEDRELYDAIRRTQYAVYAAFGTLTP
ncbi:nuclease domain-containing protein [Profundibacterium mesophilum]|uniref:Bacteriophage protein n=1 Tax=Profundibacterium mesophilum KAUST100406-0324 TaxID=1037889 RepID=A0A921NNM5_9RHOB|nr:nuclease domain-containing protein [Profundibacterium mesophilum]KAF0675096.1 putative bacteriophage protein [Profundibacterium mesophilum KAUST100406-0324]